MTNLPALRGFNGESSFAFRRATSTAPMIAGISELNSTIRAGDRARGWLSGQAITMSLRNIGSTAAAISGPLPQIDIRGRQKMAMLAMCLVCVFGRRAHAAQIINSTSDGFEVSGIDTTWIATEMVEFKARRNGRVEELESESVSRDHAAFEVKASISTRLSPDPFPAFMLSAVTNLSPESIDCVHDPNLTINEVI